MLEQITHVNEQVIEGLFQIYAESMSDLEADFTDKAEMKKSYASFLKGFIEKPNQLVLIEKIDGKWVSGLRVIEEKPGKWFVEAVETAPAYRNNGYGKKLLLDTIAFLKNKNADRIECTIAKDNTASIKVHSACGFQKTNESPINCWGELEEETELYRFSVSKNN